MPIGNSGDVLACTYPRPIRQAQARAALLPDLWSSPLLRLVQTLIAFTPLAAPTQPLIFRREVPASALDVSTRTIDRLLGQLAALGFIERLKQERFGKGSWGCTRVAWTEKAHRELFVARSTPANVAPLPSPPATGALASTETIDARETCVGSADRATTVAHKSEVFVLTECSKNSSSQHSVQARRLPSDLEQLATGLQLSVRALCALMAAAKAAKQRLQHVLAVKVEYMRQQAITGARAYRYLLACINSGNDFAWQATQHARQAQQRHEEASKQDLFARCQKQLAQGRYSLPDGRQTLGASGDFVEILSGSTRGSLPIRRLLSELAAASGDWLRALAEGRIPKLPTFPDSNRAVKTEGAPTPRPRAGSDHARIRADLDAIRRRLGCRPAAR